MHNRHPRLPSRPLTHPRQAPHWCLTCDDMLKTTRSPTALGDPVEFRTEPASVAYIPAHRLEFSALRRRPHALPGPSQTLVDSGTLPDPEHPISCTTTPISQRPGARHWLTKWRIPAFPVLLLTAASHETCASSRLWSRPAHLGSFAICCSHASSALTLFYSETLRGQCDDGT